MNRLLRSQAAHSQEKGDHVVERTLLNFARVVRKIEPIRGSGRDMPGAAASPGSDFLAIINDVQVGRAAFAQRRCRERAPQANLRLV